MTTAVLTTPVARYAVSDLLLKYWCSRVITDQTNTLRLEVWNALGERIQDFGNVCVDAPAIWTHVPIPLGFPIEAIHAQFERRAEVVLRDAESPIINFSKMDDGRYVLVVIRMAWMMYLDLAISQRN